MFVRFQPKTIGFLRGFWPCFLSIGALVAGAITASPLIKIAVTVPIAWFAVPTVFLGGMLLFLPPAILAEYLVGPRYWRAEDVAYLKTDPEFDILESPGKRHIRKEYQQAFEHDLRQLESREPSLHSFVAKFQSHPDTLTRFLWRDVGQVVRLCRRHHLPSQVAAVTSRQAQKERWRLIEG